MSRSNATVGLVLAVAFFFGGCRVGTDLPADPPPEIEVSEAEAVVAALMAPTLANTVFSQNHASFQHAHGEEGLHSHPVEGPWLHDGGGEGPLMSHHNLFTFDLVLEPNCGEGGTVLLEAAVTGEGNPAVEVGTVHYVGIQTHDECVISTGQGTAFLLRAAPYLEVESHASNDGTTTRVFGSIVGTLGWQAEAKGGTCPIDIGWDAAAATLATIESIPIAGSFCAKTVALTVDPPSVDAQAVGGGEAAGGGS